jgi:hypothetical protein
MHAWGSMQQRYRSWRGTATRRTDRLRNCWWRVARHSLRSWWPMTPPAGTATAGRAEAPNHLDAHPTNRRDTRERERAVKVRVSQPASKASRQRDRSDTRACVRVRACMGVCVTVDLLRGAKRRAVAASGGTSTACAVGHGGRRRLPVVLGLLRRSAPACHTQIIN